MHLPFPLRLLNTLVFVALATHGPSTSAQTTYRCGNSYSQTPCPDAKVIEPSDPRTPAQKLQADGAARRDERSADALEQERLKAASRVSTNEGATKNAKTSKQAKKEKPAAHVADAGVFAPEPQEVAKRPKLIQPKKPGTGHFKALVVKEPTPTYEERYPNSSTAKTAVPKSAAAKTK